MPFFATQAEIVVVSDPDAFRPYVGADNTPRAVVVPDAVWCGVCKPEPEPVPPRVEPLGTHTRAVIALLEKQNGPVHLFGNSLGGGLLGRGDHDHSVLDSELAGLRIRSG